MAKKTAGPPFYESFLHKKELFDIDDRTAIEELQTTYANFKTRNESLVTRQNEQQNATQVQLLSHFAILATLTLTVTGFLLTQNNVSLSERLKFLILCILLAEIISLFLGAVDYIQTIRFHQQWAHIYHDIGEEVDRKFESAELQWLGDMNKIEDRHLANQPAQTKMWITYSTIAFCLIGLFILFLLFYGYFFDVPFIK